MSRRFLFPLALLCTLSSCRSDSATGDPGPSGRFQLQGSGRRSGTLVDAPAIARYCPRDSVLSIVVMNRRWVVAAALHMVWPADSARSLPIASAPGAAGEAVIALRRYGDSIQTAIMAATGLVRIEAGPGLRGTLEVMAPGDSMADTLVMTGRIADVVVQANVCATL